jgi:hypothetical protein
MHIRNNWTKSLRNICVARDHGYVPFVVITILSPFHFSRLVLITGFCNKCNMKGVTSGAGMSCWIFSLVLWQQLFVFLFFFICSLYRLACSLYRLFIVSPVHCIACPSTNVIVQSQWSDSPKVYDYDILSGLRINQSYSVLREPLTQYEYIYYYPTTIVDIEEEMLKCAINKLPYYYNRYLKTVSTPFLLCILLIDRQRKYI